MKKLIVALAGVLMMVGYAQAGPGCCPWSAKKAADAADQAEDKVAEAKASLSGCDAACLDILDLTAEQKEKIDLVRAECDAMECSESAMKKMTKELATILSEDQIEQMKEHCAEECAAKEAA